MSTRSRRYAGPTNTRTSSSIISSTNDNLSPSIKVKITMRGTEGAELALFCNKPSSIIGRGSEAQSPCKMQLLQTLGALVLGISLVAASTEICQELESKSCAILTCSPGKDGIQGKEGKVGRKGEKGERGPQGPVGLQGRSGISGPPGPRGEQGQQGQRGEKGDSGASDIALQTKERKSVDNNALHDCSSGQSGVVPSKIPLSRVTGCGATSYKKRIKDAVSEALATLQPPTKHIRSVQMLPSTSTLCPDARDTVESSDALQFSRGAGDKLFATNGIEANYNDAVATCTKAGGQLASPQNSNENQAVLAIVLQYNKSAYLGINDMETEGKFIYPNGETLGYSNWYTHEPNNYHGAEDCVEISTAGKWNDKNCSERHLIICEFKK
ncbi:mannose-binding protein C-like [Bombina bombina]|uniref:mannose-binding protein C-like n=1 Tax=Bombina bombina TaxID=8345 RepID=UPI00235A6D18|nr:mannose-binding protein C-like [Bombina bombina]